MGSKQDIEAGPLTPALRKSLTYVDKIADATDVEDVERIRALNRIAAWAMLRINDIDVEMSRRERAEAEAN